MVRPLHLLALAATTFLSGLPAVAAPSCFDRVNLPSVLQSFREVPAHAGLRDDGSLLEIWVSPEGTWTLINTFPTGRSCIITWGTDWTVISDPEGVPA